MSDKAAHDSVFNFLSINHSYLMKPKNFLTISIAVLASLLSSSCLVQETVTVNGEVMKEDYVVKDPVKDVIDNTP